RYATYEYDGQGRASRSYHIAEGVSVDSFQFTYNSDGSTSVTDSLGVTRQHRFTDISGIARTTSIDGSPSPRCAHKTANYDSQTAYPVKRVNWNGYARRFQRNDPYGRKDLETLSTIGLNADDSARPETQTVKTAW